MRVVRVGSSTASWNTFRPLYRYREECVVHTTKDTVGVRGSPASMMIGGNAAPQTKRPPNSSLPRASTRVLTDYCKWSRKSNNARYFTQLHVRRDRPIGSWTCSNVDVLLQVNVRL